MWRSLFFAPANRLDLVAKFARYAADNYVLDLEDGTPPNEKDAARAGLAGAIAMLRKQDLSGRVLVRVNVPSSDAGRQDIAALDGLDIDGVVLPKCETARDTMETAARVGAGGHRTRSRLIVAGIESIEGVLNVLEVLRAAPLIRSAYFGAEDLASELGARRTPGGDEVIYARQRVVLAAKAAGVTAIDQAITEIRDRELFLRDAERGKTFGYEGKICLTPSQADLANEAFSPRPEEVERAERLLGAFASAQDAGKGTFDFEGQMVDEPLVKRARAILVAAGRAVAR